MAGNRGRAEDKVLNPRVVTELLQCPICFQILKEPTMTPCHHWFCAKCITQSLEVCHGQCPFCRSAVDAEFLSPDRLMTDIVSDVGVRCRNHPGGCDWVGPSKKRETHELACLVSHLLAWQHQAENSEDARHRAEEELSALRIELGVAEKAIVELRSEVGNLKLQAEADSSTIGSLRQTQQKLENEVVEKNAVIAAMRCSLAPVVVDMGVQCEIGPTQQKLQPRDRLLVAAERGDLKVVKQILSQEVNYGVDVNAVTTLDGRSALHLAILFGHSSIVEMLLESDCFEAVNVCDKDENTALHLACLYGREDVVQMLLSSSRFQAVPLQNRHGATALHHASARGYSQITQMLLETDRFSDVAVNAFAEEELTIKNMLGQDETVQEDGFTALHFAAKSGHIAVANVLLKSPRFRSPNAMTTTLKHSALHVASLAGSMGVVKELLQSPHFTVIDASDIDDRSALHVAAAHGQAEVISCLLRSSKFTVASQKTKAFGSTALHAAARFGCVAAAALLLESDDFPASAVNIADKHGYSAFHAASWWGSLATVKVFLESDKTAVNCLDSFGSSALHIAASRGHADVVEMLLKHPRVTAATTSLLNRSGRNALHLASMQCHVEATRRLLQVQSYPDHAVNAGTSREGATALHMAIQSKSLPVVQLLLDSPRFSAVNSATKGDGHTALQRAATKGDADIVKALLETGRFTADSVNAVDTSGRTALHVMAKGGHLRAAEVLRASGKFTMVAARCQKGRLAVNVARAEGHAEMIHMLETWDR